MQAKALLAASRDGTLVSTLLSAVESAGGAYLQAEIGASLKQRVGRAVFKGHGVPVGNCMVSVSLPFAPPPEGTVVSPWVSHPRDGDWWRRIAAEGVIGEPIAVPEGDPTFLFIHALRGQARTVRLVPTGAGGGFAKEWTLACAMPHRVPEPTNLDNQGKLWVRSMVAETQGMRLGLGDRGRYPIAISVPGVMLLNTPTQTMKHLMQEGGMLGARLFASLVARGINSAKRSGTRETVEAFYGYPNGDPEESAITEWANMRKTRQRLMDDTVTGLQANIREWTKLRSEALDRVKRTEVMSLDILTGLRELVEARVVEEVKSTVTGVFIKLFPLHIRCDEGRGWPAGLYEQPQAVVFVPNSGPLDLKILDALTGNCHRHPPVALGPEQGGRPCWGETTEIKRRNEAFVQDLWLTDIHKFITFIMGYLGNIYDEANETRYQPFQAWCRRIGD